MSGQHQYDASCHPCIKNILDESDVGIANFVTCKRKLGLGGQIKRELEDFQVLEIPREEDSVLRQEKEELQTSNGRNNLKDGATPKNALLFRALSTDVDDENLPCPTPSTDSGDSQSDSDSSSDDTSSRSAKKISSESKKMIKRRKLHDESSKENHKIIARIVVSKASEAVKSSINTVNNTTIDAKLDSNSSSNYSMGPAPVIIHFTLLKRGIDTLEAISQLALITGFPVKCFGFGGIKDSFAVTAQTCSLKVLPDDSNHYSSKNAYHIMKKKREQRYTEGPESCSANDIDEEVRFSKTDAEYERKGRSYTFRKVTEIFANRGVYPEYWTRTECYDGKQCKENDVILNCKTGHNENGVIWTPTPQNEEDRIDISNMIDPSSIEVRDLRLASLQLYPGNLVGNWFFLAIRGCREEYLKEEYESRKMKDKDENQRGEDDAVVRRSRAANPAPTKISEFFADLDNKGFVNYIGLQRFGKNGIRSDHVGLLYFQQEYSKIVEMFLYPPNKNGISGGNISSSRGSGRDTSSTPFVSQEMNKWRDTFARIGCAQTALKQLDNLGDYAKKLWTERRLLIAFAKFQERFDENKQNNHSRCINTKDDESFNNGSSPRVSQYCYYEACRYAFLSLPRNIRVIYVHAYLDRIWNLAASERLRVLDKHHVCEGDLVMVEDKQEECVNKTIVRTRRQPKVLVREDVESGKYSIFDVVLPRLGFKHFVPEEGVEQNEISSWGMERSEHAEEDDRVGPANVSEAMESSGESIPLRHVLPTNQVGNLMKQYLNYDGVDELKVEMRMDPETLECDYYWEVPGSYRNLIQRPKEMAWEIDFGESAELAKPTSQVHDQNESVATNAAISSSALSETAVIKTRFWLEPGTYATMAMRELLVSREETGPRQRFFSDDE